jgi:hypothetical protein
MTCMYVLLDVRIEHTLSHIDSAMPVIQSLYSLTRPAREYALPHVTYDSVREIKRVRVLASSLGRVMRRASWCKDYIQSGYKYCC